MKIKGRKNYKAGPKDEAGTPPYGIVPLLNQIEWYRVNRGIPRDEFVIYECAPGFRKNREPHTGIINGFEAVGYKVFSVLGEDFTAIDFDEVNHRCYQQLGLKIGMIVTNPPFSVALKRAFIKQCDDIFDRAQIPYGLLMNTTTLVEKISGQTLRGCAVHVPLGRICFNMPNKGWGTVEEPTKATFATNWFSKGIANPYSINYDWFDMSSHFDALNKFYFDFIKEAHWITR